MFPFSLPCLFRRSGSAPSGQVCLVGGYDISRLNFMSANVCECEINNAVSLVESGFDEYRLDPAAVAAKFLNSPSVPCAFRGKPAYLKCLKTLSCKTYVVLGISCVGDAVFELDCRDTSCGKKIYTVSRAAFICG